MRDPIDEKILCELRRNAKIPVTTLAKTVGRSRTAVQARIDRLEASGQIKHYTIAEPENAQAGEVGAIILVTIAVISRSAEFIAAVREIPEILSCHGISGNACYALFIRRTDAENLSSISKRIYKLEGVTKTETIISLETVF